MEADEYFVKRMSGLTSTGATLKLPTATGTGPLVSDLTRSSLTRTPAEAQWKELPPEMPRDLTSYYLHADDQLDGSVYTQDFLQKRLSIKRRHSYVG